MLRRHFNATTVIAIVALVFAMTGGAFAVTGKGGGSPAAVAAKKKSKKAVSKGLRGPAGPRGATGPAGPAGPQGPAGPEGKAGASGKDGAPGTSGKDGVSVTSVEKASGVLGPCKEGGSEFTAASGKTFACNGAKGKEGTFGGQTLPSGKTLTGHWAMSGYGEAAYPTTGYGTAAAAVSFALPLGETPGSGVFHYMDEEEVENKTDKAGCTGSVEQPGAEPGNVCVFAEAEINVGAGSAAMRLGTLDESGFVIDASTGAKGRIVAFGTWAVTAK